MSGAANGNYRTGRYSKALPVQLAQRYDEARTNPRLLSLSDDIALAEARLAHLLEQVESGESGAAWRQLQDALQAFSGALANQDAVAMNTHYATLQRLASAGRSQAAVWDEIGQVLEWRCKLVTTETKTLLGMQQLMTVQQMGLMLGAVHDALTRAVKAHADVRSGRKILMEVEQEFTRLATLEAK